MFSATPEEILFRKMRKKCHITQVRESTLRVNPCNLIKLSVMPQLQNGTQTARTIAPGNIALGLRTGSPVTLRNLQSEDWRMLSKSAVIGCVLALVSLIGASSAKADSVTIQNADFSQLSSALVSCGTGCMDNNGPIPGWVYSGNGGEGSFQPGSTYYTSLPPGETTVAYINGGKLTQDVGALLSNTTYTLTVYVGNRLDNLTTDYSFGLATGPLVDATWSNNGLITPGTFQAETISFTTGSNVSGDLSIFLADAGPQADFGNVSLNAVSTPEPSSLLMLGIGLLGLLFLGKRFGLKRPEQLTVSN